MAAAELHLLGQLTGASGFPLSSLFCKFSIESGSNFRVLQGVVEGQTQCDQPNVRSLTSPALPRPARVLSPTRATAAWQEEEMAVWSHPIDVHYTLKGIDGWPRLKLEVWGVDGFGRNELGAPRPPACAPEPSRRPASRCGPGTAVLSHDC